MKNFCWLCALTVFATFHSTPVHAEKWQELKGKHFIVYYQPAEDRLIAKQLLKKSEEYYRSVGDQIGFTRYKNFWTWDERVKIIMFPDQESFMKITGQPDWSTGYAQRESHFFKSRSIVTYKQEYEFLDGLLPHEIAHLVLHDFIEPKNSFPTQGTKGVPLWFDEGVAQLQEVHKSKVADHIMRVLVRDDNYIRLQTLLNLDIRSENDPYVVKVFYAQSLSVVEFLSKQYGHSAFARLCRNLRNGKSFEEALRKSYSNNIQSVADLEHKWLSYMKR